jgi:3-phosphoshikimate 1-carboxyvinyltransferase
MKTIDPCRILRGSIQPPGDKSIAHRYAMLGAIAAGETHLHNYPSGQDVHSTLSCLRQLGVPVEAKGGDVRIMGRGLHGLQVSAQPLDVGNSGTTIRLLSGILAGQPFLTRIHGDESISRRPMRRVIAPLRQMGASIQARDEAFPPMEIQGGKLKAIDFRPQTPSAQVKSCVLLAGLYAKGCTRVIEPVATRNHTELALGHFGAAITVDSGGISLRSGAEMGGITMNIPGDISSAMFWIVGALIRPGSEVTLENVGLNPSRDAVIRLLTRWGASIQIHPSFHTGMEVTGSLTVRHSARLGEKEPLEVRPEDVPLMIDEIPALAVLGAHAPKGMRIRGAEELRVKESDRLKSVAENLKEMGIPVIETSDGLEIEGGHSFHGGEIRTYKDHRIAMAFAIAALGADGPSTLDDPGCAAVSYPNFYEHLRVLTGK